MHRSQKPKTQTKNAKTSFKYSNGSTSMSGLLSMDCEALFIICIAAGAMWPISFFSVFQQQLQHVYLSVF
jgi:hypothetical protein